MSANTGAARRPSVSSKARVWKIVIGGNLIEDGLLTTKTYYRSHPDGQLHALRMLIPEIEKTFSDARIMKIEASDKPEAKKYFKMSRECREVD